MTNKAYRSGDSNLDRDDKYYRRTWYEIIDKVFSQTIFYSYPALVRKELVNGQLKWQPYNGSGYDKDKFELIKDKWDHEHCAVCNFKIREGQTYWFNKGRIRLLCDECHDYYTSHNIRIQPDPE